MNKKKCYYYVLNNLINILIEKNENEFTNSIFSYFMKKKVIYNIDELIIRDLKEIFLLCEKDLILNDLILIVKKIINLEPKFKYYLRSYENYEKENIELTRFYKQIEQTIERNEDVE